MWSANQNTTEAETVPNERKYKEWGEGGKERQKGAREKENEGKIAYVLCVWERDYLSKTMWIMEEVILISLESPLIGRQEQKK